MGDSIKILIAQLLNQDSFQEKLLAYNERRKVNLKFCLADFVYLIQKLFGGCFI